MLLSWNWSVNLVLPLPTFSTIRGIDELTRAQLAEPPSEEDTGPIASVR
jgi:hypothetical protein